MLLDMGFKNGWEFLKSLFGVWYMELVLIFSLASSLIIIGLDTFVCYIDQYLYSPPAIMMLVMAALLVDWITGVYGAIKTKSFQTDRAKRIIPISITNLVFLIGLFNAEIHLLREVSPGAETAFHYFRMTVSNYMFFVPFLSAMVNASKHGLINIKFVNMLSEYVDTHKETSK